MSPGGSLPKVIPPEPLVPCSPEFDSQSREVCEMTPSSGRQTRPYKLKGPSGNRIGGRRSSGPKHPTTATITYTLLFHRQAKLWSWMCCQPASWPFRGIRLIKCKCVSWGRKWREVVQIINWDAFLSLGKQIAGKRSPSWAT